MIPDIEKYYILYCDGPYHYNVYFGVGRYTGYSEPFGDESVVYEFVVHDESGVNNRKVLLFLESDIKMEITKDQYVDYIKRNS